MNKINRNDPCHCGSGKKYKKCCLRKDEDGRRLENNLKADFVPNASDEYWEAEPFEGKHQGYMPEDNEDDLFGPCDEVVDDDDEEEEEEEERVQLSSEENQLIDDWWQQYNTMKDPDILCAHVEKFLDDHPHLVTALDLHKEPLLKLKEMYTRKRRYDEYPALLSRLRTEFPAAYQKSDGYLDNHLITHLIINNRKEEVRQHLEFFRQHPAKEPDILFEVIDFLSCWNCLDILSELVPEIYRKLSSSPNIFFGHIIMGTVVPIALTPHLDKGLDAADPHAVAADMKKYDDYIDPSWTDPEFIQKRIDLILDEHQQWDIAKCKTRQRTINRYDDICAHFMGWLAANKDLDWLAADFHRRMVLEYLAHALPEKKKPREPFPFEEKIMESVLMKLSRNMFWLDPTTLFGSLNGLYWFTEFLEATSSISPGQALQGRESCTRIFERSYPIVLEQNSKALAWERFPR